MRREGNGLNLGGVMTGDIGEVEEEKKNGFGIQPVCDAPQLFSSGCACVTRTLLLQTT